MFILRFFTGATYADRLADIKQDLVNLHVDINQRKAAVDSDRDLLLAESDRLREIEQRVARVLEK